MLLNGILISTNTLFVILRNLQDNIFMYGTHKSTGAKLMAILDAAFRIICSAT